MGAMESVSAREAALLLIDVQEYFVPLMAAPIEPVMVRLEYLLALASVYDLRQLHFRTSGCRQGLVSGAVESPLSYQRA